jgi:MFS family permease
MTTNHPDSESHTTAPSRFLPRGVVILALVSFLNDTASEMIMPLLPVFLTVTLGAGPMALGLIEGVAEATASILKLVSGRQADKGWDRKSLVVGGYTLSNTARPIMALATGWGMVMVLRFFDRVGKGVRTSPRDAMIALSVPSSLRGRAHGFHRMMDHAGAMVGPVIAFALLQIGLSTEQVFLSSIVPGLLVVLLLVFGLTRADIPKRDAIPAAPPPLHWRGLDYRIRGLLLTVSGMALAKAPDAFLLLWASEKGMQLVYIPLLWAAANGAKAIAAGPGGYLSDRFGRTPIVVSGWGARVILLMAFAFVPSDGSLIWTLFLVHAAAIAFTEGAERALVGDYSRAGEKATVFGLYHLLSGLLVLPGAMIFGFVWQLFGMDAAFFLAAILTAISVASFVALNMNGKK